MVLSNNEKYPHLDNRSKNFVKYICEEVMIMKFKVANLFLLSLLLSTMTWAQWGQEHERRSWYIGFGFGSGTGSFVFDGDTVTLNEMFEGLTYTTVTINFKVGGTVSPYLLVGFDVSAIRRQGSGEGITAAVQINNYDAMVTYFPLKEGFFIRGGGGFSSAIKEISGYGTAGVGGVNVLIGTGYAFWLLKSFNLVLNLDYSTQFYGGKEGDPDRSQFLNFYLGFDWY